VNIVAIELSKKAEKQVKKLPKHVKSKLDLWARSVLTEGLDIVRRNPSFHDEPLSGPKKGIRSIRLNRQWRAEYCIENREGKVIIVIEVHPHDYKNKK
jgi:proteic killer suppression protein